MRKPIPVFPAGLLFLLSLACCCMILVSLNACGHNKSVIAPSILTSTMSDRDGNTYPRVKIGNQWWVAADLKVKTYLNGDSITYKSSDTKWKDTTEGYCSISTSSFLVGLLYNGYALNDARKLAPAGWHIPTDSEWKTLEMEVGMSGTEADKISWRGSGEGDKLKREKASTQPFGAWADAANVYLVWPNNQSGFSALAGSCRLFNGIWGDPGPGGTGFWWSSSQTNNQIWYRYLDYNKSNVFRYYGDKRYGFSIRCVKD